MAILTGGHTNGPARRSGRRSDTLTGRHKTDGQTDSPHRRADRGGTDGQPTQTGRQRRDRQTDSPHRRTDRGGTDGQTDTESDNR